jgi:hypothetical protein
MEGRNIWEIGGGVVDFCMETVPRKKVDWAQATANPDNPGKKIYDNLVSNVTKSTMNFTKDNYRAAVTHLRESVEFAGRDHVSDIEEGDVHMSFHSDTVPAGFYDVGARGAICYAIIEETQPEELLAGRHWSVLRRSNVNTVRGWTIYFFADGVTMHCDPGIPDCYRAAATDWLRVHIRNEAGGGGAAAAAADDGLGPLESREPDDGMCGSSNHSNTSR